MEIIKLSRDEWLQYSEQAHLICFGETGYSRLERCDYALLVVDRDAPLMYATIKETDAESTYLQRGGAFPSSKNTALSYRAFDLILSYLKAHSKHITMRVLNTNIAMLKFAMKAGFLIDGVNYAKGNIYLDHYLEVSNVVGFTFSNSSVGCEQGEQAGGSAEAV